MESINGDITQNEFEELRNRLFYLEMLEHFEPDKAREQEIKAIKKQLEQGDA